LEVEEEEWAWYWYWAWYWADFKKMNRNGLVEFDYHCLGFRRKLGWTFGSMEMTNYFVK
jgi:hypothetical protein